MVKDRSFYSTLAKIALPLALQNLITFGIGLADNFMVGSLGDLALSGVFLSNQVQWILQMLCAGLSAAMVVLAAQYIGKGDIKNAKIVINITLKIAFAVGLALTVVVLFIPRAILGLFTEDQAVIAEGMKYIGVVCFSYVFFCCSNMLLASMRCVQNTKIGFLSSLTGFCVNVFLNWVLIFGHLGMPVLGVKGAAIATVIARASEFTVAFCYARFGDKILAFRLADLRLWNKLLLGDFFKYGFPVILGDIIWGIAGTVQVAILGRLGAEVLAANTIAANLHQLLGVIVYAIAGASGVIIGRTVGSGDIEKVKAYSKTLQKIFICFGLVTGIIIFLLKDFILALGFKAISPEAHSYAIQFLTVFSITIVGTSYQMSVLTGIVRAGGATSFVLLNDLFWVWVVVIPSALLSAFVFHFPPVVVFACLKCDQIFKCSVAVVKLHKWNWMKKLTRES
ncbi:MATE family efflux transporter [Leadbettera azotonutricia]|uniref:MATE efflux family protein n=1 Tax=Leadbettera azotonutricia (strain ATCC BAA-888 / DSM 13862 / ZAS-9) TaxID=545695 RepID=F5Y9C7_LEAAZ|nr:MATE family efflux transporter [Leadbettera azotonutricia]AEF80945.1 MATE efflux family protein [Leadbettera azotonutricia ZAS-9]